MGKIIVSGIKPTGELTLGNYIGGIKQFLEIQDSLEEGDLFFLFIADLHALTVKSEKANLKKRIRDIALNYLACGLDPNKVTIFCQSDVIEHPYLGWIMESTSYMGEMERMTQYKDKKLKQEDGIRTSLFTYPALMASDILLYNANYVPIGDDQTQHLELTRNLAERFNSYYGKTFNVPEAIYPKVGKRIKSLQDPSKKMSKTDDDPKSYILLLDDLATARNKIKSAVTDSLGGIKYDEVNKPGISNLLTIYSALTNTDISLLEEKYRDLQYQAFKNDLGEIVYKFLENLHSKFNSYTPKDIEDILVSGANKASIYASRMIKKVKGKVGLGILN
ncbi:MAG: tryptophan--tRNA ligase [Acholeplasmatales bacterium]|jgi:tryptophanyl-tRNA synthetase|nr:tryptophan--tRNA ligase [Acholeplasmatales bacterium]